MEDSLAITVSARQWIGLCALAGGYFIALLDLTIINLAVSLADTGLKCIHNPGVLGGQQLRSRSRTGDHPVRSFR